MLPLSFVLLLGVALIAEPLHFDMPRGTSRCLLGRDRRA
jgi:hypothetical protein